MSQIPRRDVLLDHIVVSRRLGRITNRPSFIMSPLPCDRTDFKLRNQDGRAIHLDQFRGKTLLLKFIYMRCPLPNFCPLVTHNFAVINRQLSATPRFHEKTHPLSREL